MPRAPALYNDLGGIYYMPFREAFREEDLPFPGYALDKIQGLPETTIKRYDLPCLNYSEYD